jgi:hypothetical protein
MTGAAHRIQDLPNGPRDPIQKADDLLASLRYTNPFAWWQGRADGRRGYPTSFEQDGKTYEGEAGYEKLVRERFYQRMLKARVPILIKRKRQEALRQLALKAKADFDALYKDKKEEYDEAERAFQESYRKYGFSAWTWRRKARRFLLFSFEVPINYLAFSGHGDSPILTLPTVLSMSMIIAVGSHMAGKMLKHAAEGSGGKNARRVGVAFLLMLAGLVACVAIFRMDSFIQMASRYREISDSNAYIIGIFYGLLQLIFISAGALESYSYTKPTDEIEALQLKFDKSRYQHAESDMEKVRRPREHADQTLASVEVELSRLSESESLEMYQLESRCRELIGVYRKSNLRRRSENVSPPPPSWLRGGTALWEFRYGQIRDAGSNAPDYSDNRNGSHRERPSMSVKP